MLVKRFTVNHFGVNCYVLADEGTKRCAIVDPAAEASYEEAQITQYLDEHGFKPVYILLTHAHIDHIAGLREMCQRYGLPVTMHPDGVHLLRQAEAYGSVMGFDVKNMGDLEVCEIQDNDILALGEGKIECRHVPGHCPGSICYVLHDEHLVLTGDALFCGSIGRTDLPGGNYQLLIEKIKSRLLTLPDDYLVLPGHGETSNIYDEKHHNGFLV
ncbi:MAG: MBL fold metallo-hydrolase [Bacteroidales bacterium]|nr:MBL fold metallo-hydrolase [Bacteroidales bacterium]